MKSSATVSLYYDVTLHPITYTYFKEDAFLMKSSATVSLYYMTYF